MKALSEALQGSYQGKPDTILTHPAKIEEGDEGAVCFIANTRYLPHAYTTRASALIVGHDIELTGPVAPAVIRVADAYSAFTQVLKMFEAQNNSESGISPYAFVDPSATIGEGTYIGPLVFIGSGATIGNRCRIYPQAYVGEGVAIGEDTMLFSGAKVYHGCRIGSHNVLHAGVVIGGDGFGFAPQEDGSYTKIPQTGNVETGDHVEIGANTTIDRATIGSTRIGHGVKIDNLVQIAHNVVVGDHTVIAAQAGISGSTRIGKYCQIGGQAGIIGHLEIADYTRINAQSGVSKSVKEKGAKLTGSPAGDYTATLRAQAVMRRLPELEKRIEILEAILRHYQNADKA